MRVGKTSCSGVPYVENIVKMSFSACKTFATAATKVLLSTTFVGNAAIRTRLPVYGSRALQTQRSFTRSMWHMTGGGRRGEEGPLAAGAQWMATTKSCGCCGLHTQGDKEMCDFVGEEINHEKKTQVSALPTIKGFTMKADGTVITLMKEVDGETLTIEINVNHSVEDADGEFEGKEKQNAEMVSRPPFVVKLRKGGDVTLGIQCDFPNQEELPPAGDNQDYVDVIEIQEVAILRGNDWSEKVYAVAGTVMDGTLYDMLMNMMEERGVDATFVEEMVALCTAYDHKLYIDFLESLKSFAEK